MDKVKKPKKGNKCLYLKRLSTQQYLRFSKITTTTTTL